MSHHRITDYQARTLLGLSRSELDGFLKARGVYLDDSMKDLEREVAASVVRQKLSDPEFR